MQRSGAMRASRSAIRYSFGNTCLGTDTPPALPVTVLVARRESGLCGILLGDAGNALLSELQERFPAEALLPDENGLAETLQQVCDLIAGRRNQLDQPLAPEGTPFQRRVWEALQAIPAGVTVTYTQIADNLGLAPTAVRAVAGACAANPCAVAIPCHRVIRENGGLAGYRWGVERKRALLHGEAARALEATAFSLAPFTLAPFTPEP